MNTPNQIMKFLIAVSMMMSAGLATAADGWYDGQRWRTLHEDPRQLAQLELGASTDAAGLPARVNSVRLRSVTKAGLESARGDVSLVQVPVFRDHPGGPIRVAIGGVIVQLSENLTAEEQANWLGREGLTLMDSPEGLPWIVVAAQPGRPSIDLANRLYKLPEVVQASPNWWQPVASR